MFDRIFVPSKAQKNILENLHIQHMGQNKTCQIAKQFYFWPTMWNEIKQMHGLNLPRVHTDAAIPAC